jgi:hypothetical protein
MKKIGSEQINRLPTADSVVNVKGYRGRANPKFAALVKKKLLFAGSAGVSPACIQMLVIKALVIP